MYNPQLARSFIFYIATLLFLGVGAMTTPQLAWYNTLTLPVFAPAPMIIAAIWCVLFYLTAYSLATFWSAKEIAHGTSFAFIVKLYLANAALIVAWNWLFFGMHLLSAAAIAAVAVLLSILVLMICLWHVSKKAAVLLAPYIVWIMFALYLNHVISILNP